MPPSTNLNDGAFMSDLGFINYDPYSDFDLDLDESPTEFLDLIQSNADPSQNLAKDVFQSGHRDHPLPAPSPPASDQDSASDSSATHRTDSSSASAPAMNGGDVEMAGIWDQLESNPRLDWEQEGDFVPVDSMHSIFDSDTIDPAVIGAGFGDHVDFGDAQSASRHDSSSPSDSSPSPTAVNGSDESPPAEDADSHNVFSFKGCPAEVQSPSSTRSKRNSNYSLSKSMNGLRTTGSREVSPTSHMVFSQGSSPSAVPNFATVDTDMSDYNGTAAGNTPRGGWLRMPVNAMSPGQPAPGSINYSHVTTSVPTHFPMMQQPSFIPPRSQLIIHSIPPKSRVETQIPIRMTLHPVPAGIKKLHLPPHTISKPKLLAKPKPAPAPDTLEMYTQLVCTSAMSKPASRERALARAASCGHPSDGTSDDDDEKPENGGEVRICAGCVTREHKRANRKKVKKPEEEENWKKDESKRVIVFNTQEIKEWQQPPPELQAATPQGTLQIEAPMRIACYCRHHHEKIGFQVIFTLKDHLGQLVTQALSPSIMITDDHKTQPAPNSITSVDAADQTVVPQAPNGINDMNVLQPGHPFRQSQSTSDIQALKRSANVPLPPPINPGNLSQRTSAAPTPRNLSRPPSPSAVGPSAKKRKSSSTKVPSNLHMTRIETSSFAPQPSNIMQNGQPGASASTSPFTPPNSVIFPDIAGGAVFGQPAPATNPSFPTGPPTPNSNDQLIFPGGNRTTSTESMSVTPLYTAPPSAHASRAPSPNGLRNGALLQQQQQQQQQHNQLDQVGQMLAQGLPMSASFANPGQLRQPISMSVIHKVIPNEGPMSGGIEVTILGSGFYQGLDVIFGDRKATTTTFWGEQALHCLLPPYHLAGTVPVTLRGPNGQPQTLPLQARPQATFTYKDESENHLLRLALGVLSNKLNGNTDDMRGFVNRIIEGSGTGGVSGGSGGGFSGGVQGYNMNLEGQLLKILDLLDMDDSLNRARLNMKRKTAGHTMLHLSCALGLHRFTAGLLVRGAHPNVQDVGGYTPLHYAAMHNHPELVRRLIQHKADPTLKTRSNLLASDVATTRDVVRAIKRCGRRGSTPHVRASSATSLRSFWEPPRAGPASDEFSYEETTSSEEGAEFISEVDSEAEDTWLDMPTRRASRNHAPQRSTSFAELPHPEEQVGLASPAVAMAAFKDQLQQLQQTMAGRLHNLPHIPYLPQMPNMMADYQPYLNSAQIMQRMSALLPNIGGPRPGSPSENSRWWDVSSLMPSSGLPPAYDDIFPAARQGGKSAADVQGDIDTKQMSAARAAADYEADWKCAVLYDQQQATSSRQQVEGKQTPRQLPKLLQIGRKNNITKEQQDNLRQAHAENMKNLSRDRNLFFIWIPLLLVISGAMLYSHFPGLFTTSWNFDSSMGRPKIVLQQPAHGVVFG